METNLPADEPTPAPPHAPAAESAPSETPTIEPGSQAEIVETVSVPETAEQPTDSAEIPPSEVGTADELGQLAEASQRARLSPSEEERMATLLKETLQGGRAGVARAVEALPKVPWIVGVRAVEAVWPELTAGFRTQLLSGLAREETDASRRIRLSLARALFKLDVPVALKLAVGVARELPDEATGKLGAKQAQIFANVFIGRGKPWLAQISLVDLKPADGDALVHCAVLAVFALPHPPVTQLGVLKWAREQERLEKLNPTALEAVKKGVSRWSTKWQGALRREVSELPEEILAMLKPVAEQPASPEAGPVSGEPGENAERGEGAEDESLDAPPADGEARVTDSDEEDEDDEEDDEDEDVDEDEEDEDEDERGEGARKPRPVYEPRPQKSAERPVYTPRNAGGGVPKNFNLNEALRHIDGYVQSLRSELSAAQARLRTRDRGPEKSGAILQGEPTLEELARLNQQLEARNTELQQRITELTQHSEDVAVSTGALTGAPVSDGASQLRTLLALKLQEDFADFVALEKESNDLVVQQHYKSLLRHVFEVLQQLEVPLKAD